MSTRQRRPKDRRYLRYSGPFEQVGGEFRGEPVELIDPTPLGWLVRFPDGAVRDVHADRLTDALLKLDAAGQVVPA